MPTERDLAEMIRKHVELHATDLAGVFLRTSVGCRLSLAEQRQRPQDREAMPIQVLDQAEDLLALPLQTLVVEPLVPRMQLDRKRLLLTRGQIRRDEFLGPSLDQAA